MRSLLVFAAIALASCADLREPAVDGTVSSVSASDIGAINVAVRRFLAERDRAAVPIYRIHVIDHNTVHVYCGEHYGSRPPPGIESYIEVKRIKEKWKTVEIVLQGSGLTNR